MHEIVTLQFGNQSNYVGTHFWNAQESYFTYSLNETSPVDHDVHFRPGIGPDGSETFTPRAVIYDAKDNFGTLRQVSALYELQDQTDDAPGVWGRDPIIRQQPSIPPHPYQIALNNGLQSPSIQSSSIRFWSDFNRVFYHPRSMVQLTLPISHLAPAGNNAHIEPLDQWDIGEELFKTEDQEHDLLDRDLRLFVEECDQLQGFQVLSGADDAWAGFAGRYIERMRDEYGRKSIWVWGSEGMSETRSREKQRHQAINLAKSSSLLSEQATLYIPLCNYANGHSPYLSNLHTRWERSALQATAFESATLPTRLAERGDIRRGLMGDIEPIFVGETKRNVLKLSLSASKPHDDAPHINGHGAQDHRMVNGFHDSGDTAQEPEQLDMSLLNPLYMPIPQLSRRQHTFSQALFLRGFDAPAPGSPNRASPSSQIVQVYSLSLLAPRPTSFPEIFDFRPLDSHASIATKAALSATTDVAHRLRSLGEMVRRWVDVEDREELRADLLAKAEEYVDGWEDDRDSSDDGQ